MFEYWGWRSRLTTLNAWLVNGNQTGSHSELLSQTHDGVQHRYTHLFDDDTRTLRVWIDGKEMTAFKRSYPTHPQDKMHLILSASYRVAAPDFGPVGTHRRAIVARSIVVYRSSDHLSGFVGGGIAAGTQVQ